MKCENCEHVNPSDSKYCEECGNELKTSSSKAKKTHSPSIAEELEDIIFIPKKERHVLRNILIVLFAFFVIVMILISIGSKNSSSTSDNSVSNNSGNSNGSNNNFNIDCLTLSSGTMEGNTYYNPNPTYKATIHNGCDRAVSNVILRVNFYQAGCPSIEACTPKDTEYVKVAYYLAPGDSYAINQTINTNADTSGGFSWYAQVYTANPL